MVDNTAPLDARRAEMREKGRRGGYRGKGKQVHPLKIEMRELARSYGPEVLERLLAIVRNDSIDADIRVVAANVILDRGFGKPVAAQPETGNGQVVVNVVSRDGKPILPAQHAARFLSDVASVSSRPLLPEGRDPLEPPAIKPMPSRFLREPVAEPLQHRLFEDEK
jgi:hypothetical protein